MARPKKVILCVDSNEQALSVRRFFLETRGFRVLSASGAKEALALLKKATPGSVDLMVVEFGLPEMDGNALVRRAKALHPEMRTVITSRTLQRFEQETHSDVALPKAANFPAELYERIRVLTVRKRGPKGPRKALLPGVWEPVKAEGRAA